MSEESEPDDLDTSTVDADFGRILREVARTSDEPLAPALPEPGSFIADKYQIEALIGRGGMGAVFSARHRLTGKLFAIKWLLPGLSERPDAVQRFLREAQVGGQVEHLNVVEVYDVGQDDRSYYMVMELIQGETLGQRLRRCGRLDYVAACRVLIPAMRGLDAVHRAGVIHRDLKPQNIILSTTSHGEELPMVLDFGISRIVPLSGHLTPSDTHSGMVLVGTPCYMSPEQLRSRAVDVRSDVYALGVILYELLSGSLPFTADNYPDLMRKVLDEPPAALGGLVPELPTELVAVVAQAMARQPEDRYSSVESLARALEPYAGGMRFSPTKAPEGAAASESQGGRLSSATPLATSSVRTNPPLGPSLTHRKRRLLAAAGLVAVCLIAFVAYRAAVRQPVSPRVASSPAPTYDHVQRADPSVQSAPNAATPAPVLEPERPAQSVRRDESAEAVSGAARAKPPARRSGAANSKGPRSRAEVPGANPESPASNVPAAGFFAPRVKRHEI